MKTNEPNLTEVATTTGLRPADFPIGSPHSRAVARSLAEERDICAMQHWTTVNFADLKSAKAFAGKLRNQDYANPFKVRLTVRTHKTHQQAEDARSRVQPGKVSLVITDDERGVGLVRLLAERHGGVVIHVNVSQEGA